MSYKINILGSCVSRISMLDGDKTGHNTAAPDIDMQYFLDKQNIVCAMYPAPFDRGEVDAIKPEELWDKTRVRSLKQCLNKDTVELLMNSEAEWLVMDLFDMQTDFSIYKNTFFSTCAHEFLNTNLYKKNYTDVMYGNFMQLPNWVYYGVVDLFFEKIMQKYDKDHIIFNCFRANNYYLSKKGTIEVIPDVFRKPCQANSKYNSKLLELENYIINKYNPYVIDISKYFMGDENHWSNLNGAHFEKEFYRETFDIACSIIRGETTEKYHSQPRFFDYTRRGIEEDMQRKFDIESSIALFEKLLNDNDMLWLNILDKLNAYAGEDARVQQYMDFLSNALE